MGNRRQIGGGQERIDLGFWTDEGSVADLQTWGWVLGFSPLYSRIRGRRTGRRIHPHLRPHSPCETECGGCGCRKVIVTLSTPHVYPGSSTFAKKMFPVPCPVPPSSFLMMGDLRMRPVDRLSFLFPLPPSSQIDQVQDSSTKRRVQKCPIRSLPAPLLSPFRTRDQIKAVSFFRSGSTSLSPFPLYFPWTW